MVFSLLDRVTEGHLRMLQHMVELGKVLGRPSIEVSSLWYMDVEYSPDPTGQMNPQHSIFDGTYHDQHQVDVNMLIAADLENMGLIETRPVESFALEGGAYEQVSPYKQLTMKGHLFYEHITEAP